MKTKDARRLKEVAKTCSGMSDQNLTLLLAYAKGLEMGQVVGKAQQNEASIKR